MSLSLCSSVSDELMGGLLYWKYRFIAVRNMAEGEQGSELAVIMKSRFVIYFYKSFPMILLMSRQAQLVVAA